MSKPKNPKLLEVVLPPDIMGSDITLWDIYFGMAMRGLVGPWAKSEIDYYRPCDLAKDAGDIADVLLAERAKREGE